MTRRAWQLGFLGLLAIALGGLALFIVLTSESDRNKAADATLGLLVGWSFAGSGLIAWWRRPDNRFGKLLVAVGLLWFVGSLGAANDSIVWTSGKAFGNLAIAFFVQALLAFPSGRVHSRVDRALVALTWVDVVVLEIVHLLFDDFGDCGCPSNAFLVVHDQSVANAIGVGQNAIGVVIALGVFFRLARSYHRASAQLRRALAPGFWRGGLAGLFFAAQLIADTFSHRIARGINWGTIVVFASVPLAFLAGLLRSRLARSAVGRLVVELGEARAPGELRDALGRALGDPSLRLAYWLPDAQVFVDVEGRRFDLPGEGDAQTATMVEREGRRVAALVHDPSLREDPELLDAVCAAAGLALENERLQAALRSRLEDLRRERDFITAVVETAASLLLVLDAEGRIVEFNRACEQLSGYSFAEVRGRPFWDLFILPEEVEGIRRAFSEAKAGVASENENHWVTRSGERRLIAWLNTVLVDEQGRVEYIVSGGLDVTERRRQEGELRRLHAELQRRLEELKASRARILEVGDAERRRLERNLHDGAQQRLVSLSLALRLARARLSGDPEAAAETLDAAANELAHALEELRELARGIHPALLADRGLEPALEALARRAPVPVELESRLDGRLPGPVEVAAYYVVSEALANVAKYAEASSVQVSVARVDGKALVQVADDGVGGADPSRGSGLRGLRDRVEALDGRLEVESGEGEGTRIRAEIPCG